MASAAMSKMDSSLHAQHHHSAQARRTHAAAARRSGSQRLFSMRASTLRPLRRIAARSSKEDPAAADDDEPPAIMGDWRSFRAKLMADAGESSQWAARVDEDNLRVLRDQDPALASEEQWAHATPAVERGGLLIAAPNVVDLLGNERYWQVVVLVISHDAGGTVGLILNRPTGLVMGVGRGGLPFTMAGGPPGLQSVFKDSRIYCGGFVAQQVIHLLHGHALPGSMQVVPGVFVGGENEAVAKVAGGELKESSFKFFAGAVVWEPRELEGEIAKGGWITAAASRPLVLKQVLGLPTPLWREVMQLMGGEHAAAAAAAAAAAQQQQQQQQQEEEESSSGGDGSGGGGGGSGDQGDGNDSSGSSRGTSS